MTALSRAPAPLPPPGGVLRVASRLATSGHIVGRLVLDAGRAPPDEESRALRRATARLATACADLCATHGVRVVVRGRPPEGPVALVSNHVGYIDPLAILARVPAAPIAKREVSEWPLIGSAMDRAGVLWVDRACALSGATVLRRAIRALSSGVPVLVFPEGTTSPGLETLPFRRGLFGAAAIAGVPIVPVTVRYCAPEVAWVGDDDFLPHYLRTARRPRTTATVCFHDPIRARPDEEPEAVADRARRIVETSLRDHPTR